MAIQGEYYGNQEEQEGAQGEERHGEITGIDHAEGKDQTVITTFKKVLGVLEENREIFTRKDVIEACRAIEEANPPAEEGYYVIPYPPKGSKGEAKGTPDIEGEGWAIWLAKGSESGTQSTEAKDNQEGSGEHVPSTEEVDDREVAAVRGQRSRDPGEDR